MLGLVQRFEFSEVYSKLENDEIEITIVNNEEWIEMEKIARIMSYSSEDNEIKQLKYEHILYSIKKPLHSKT